MACKVAENRPLSLMRKDLALASNCHSLRGDCLKGLMRADAGYAMGAPGAALGYCQALFHAQNGPRAHTEYVRTCLKAIGAPWPSSHELFWGYKGQRAVSEYISEAVQPLTGTGRVPILITGLDPGEQYEEICDVLRALPAVAPGETILVRIILKNHQSITSIAEITRQLMKEAHEKSAMPTWWPLLQGDLSVSDWQFLKQHLGADWRYANIAVNPFTSREVLEEVWEQITVAQIPLGLAEGVLSDGTIHLAHGIKIMGAADGASYDLFKFAAALDGLPTTPTLIVLGPAGADWPEDWNIKRVGKIIPILRQSVEVFWKDLPKQRRQAVWNLES